MNTFKKYCPTAWVAECCEEYEKGDIIQLETKYGKEVDCEVYNFIFEKNGMFYYSIVRIEDKTYAERKVEKYQNSIINNNAKSNEYYKKSREGSEFLSLGEPIKIGHHSEGRHRALIERNSKRMDKSMEFYQKAENTQSKVDYWENKVTEITLAMPESLEYFNYKLEKAVEYHRKLKSGEIARAHSYSLAYATKDVNSLKEKVKIAMVLWG